MWEVNRRVRFVWDFIEEIIMSVLTIPPNEVHRNEWGELVCRVYDEDKVFLYTEQIDEDIQIINVMVLLYLLTGQSNKTMTSRS
jgi:hypothetical protein